MENKTSNAAELLHIETNMAVQTWCVTIHPQVLVAAVEFLPTWVCVGLDSVFLRLMGQKPR